MEKPVHTDEERSVWIKAEAARIRKEEPSMAPRAMLVAMQRWESHYCLASKVSIPAPMKPASNVTGFGDLQKAQPLPNNWLNSSDISSTPLGNEWSVKSGSMHDWNKMLEASASKESRTSTWTPDGMSVGGFGYKMSLTIPMDDFESMQKAIKDEGFKGKDAERELCKRASRWTPTFELAAVISQNEDGVHEAKFHKALDSDMENLMYDLADILNKPTKDSSK